MTSEKDRWSALVVMLASYAVSVVSIALFILRPPQPSLAWTIVGAFLIALGLAFRFSAVKTLDRFFTAKLQVVDDQRLITHGVFSIVRHPSYFGVVLILTAPMILYQQPWVFAVGFAGLLWAYRYRIHQEESILFTKFGEAYEAYRKQVKMIVPWIY